MAMTSQFKAKRRSRPTAKAGSANPRADSPLCEQCGKSARGPALGDWRFCKARCRAAFLTARSRRAAAQGKKLGCPACGKPNEPKARICGSCKQRILWRERSLVWSAIVWSTRVSILLSIAGSAYFAWQLKDLLGPDGPGSLLSVLGGGSGGSGGAGDLTGLLGQNPGSLENLSPEMREILAKRGTSPDDLRRALKQGGNRDLEAMLERANRNSGGQGQGQGEDIDAMLERVERGEPAGPRKRPEPKVPGPGTWLVGQRGIPAMLFAQNPTDRAFWPEGFGQMPMLEKAKALGGMVTGGKVSVLLGATEIRIVEEGSLFSEVEVASGPKAGTSGWAQTGQIFMKSGREEGLEPADGPAH